jgi:hypothetical protein
MGWGITTCQLNLGIKNPVQKEAYAGPYFGTL